MRRLMTIGLILLLVSCKSRKLTADSPERFTIENLAKVTSAEQLESIFPDAQIEEGTDMFEEGTVERAYSVLYPGTPNEVLVTWTDNSRNQIHSIRVGNSGKWRSKTGIKIGTPYEDLVRMNGPIKVYGFGWDYSGAVDWNDGKFADTDIRVFLAPKGTPPNKFYGDSVIEATEEEIKALDLSVQAILFQKPES